MFDTLFKHHTIIFTYVFFFFFLILRIGLRLVGLNNYLDIVYRLKIGKPK